MKRIFLIFIIFCSFGLIVAGAIFGAPYYYYHQMVAGKLRSKWYSLENYSPLLARPVKVELETPKLGNDNLWKDFHFKDTLVPLPVRNPFYYVAPAVNYDQKLDEPRLGVVIYDGGYREISKLYFVSNMLMGTEMRAQELFKLPLVRKIIQRVPAQKIWNDLFNKALDDWNIPYSEMVYNLYILHLRSKILPQGLVRFGSLDANTGVARLESANKDYITELVMTKTRGVVYSYIIVTEKNNKESEVLRYKFLQDISFRPGSESLAGIVYKEFQALPYKRKIDHEGMLYLLSAWSHQMDNVEFLKEMIEYLERGEQNQKQLKPLYAYATLKYGETFSQRTAPGVELSPEMSLRRNIELEEKRELEEIKSRDVGSEQRELTPEEILKNRIEEAKRSKKIKADRMILD